MRGVGLETPEFPEALAALRDSGLILREATRLERRKRWQSLDDGLEGALAACASATEEGRRTADEYLFRTREALQRARDSMDMVVGSRGRAGLTHQDSDLMSRMEELVTALEGQLLTIESVLNRKSDWPSAYNITLFGRTGAGKSTLMEILTDGKGNTIGKGAQRTTQDVRTYEWKGLKVTDVPGVAAFEGEKDAETAHEAAKEADLILFLITDDGPQPAEAKHLARLRRTGHPIIGVCNVKSTLRGQAGKRLFIRDSHRTFDPDRLEEIRRQFDEIADQHNPEQQLPLIYTHLLARFTANRTQPEELAEELKEESRFWEVEDEVEDEIAGNGAYLRTRSYTDMATEAALEASELMLQSAYVMTQLHEGLSTRVKELEEWRKAFRKKSDQKLGELLNATTGRLRNQMIPFAERNWKDRDISQKWSQEIESMDIDHRVRAELEQLHRDMRAHLKEMANDLEIELRLLASLNVDYSGTYTIGPNFQRWTRWASTAIGTVSTLLGTALMFVPGWQPLGAALAFGGGIINWIGDRVSRLWKSEDDRRREAVSSFRDQALPHVSRIEGEVRKAYRKAFNEEIDRKGASAAISKLSAMADSAKEAGSIARRVASDQQRSLAALNKITVSQALTHIGCQGPVRRIDRAARVPGQAVTLVITRGEHPTEELLRLMESLLGEKTSIIEKGTSDSSILRQATGTKALRIDKEAGTAEATYDAGDPGIAIEVRLASQLTGLHVLNRTQEA